MKEAEVLITDAKVVGDGYGTAVQYFIKVEAGDQPVGKISSASFFIDDAYTACKMKHGVWTMMACT